MLKTNFNKSKGQELLVICPECKRETRHIVMQSVDQTGQEEISNDFWIDWEAKYQIIQCQGCMTISFRMETSNSEDFNPYTGEPDVTIRLYPKRTKSTLSIKEFLNVPSNLKRIYREIIDCYNNEIFTMCAAGLRAIIEGICAEEDIASGPIEVEKDGTKKVVRKKNLEGKIAGLREKGILTQKHCDILHQHRYLGNEALHELVQPSQEELQLAINIIEHILESIYEIPQKAAEIKKQRLRRRKA